MDLLEMLAQAGSGDLPNQPGRPSSKSARASSKDSRQGSLAASRHQVGFQQHGARGAAAPLDGPLAQGPMCARSTKP